MGTEFRELINKYKLMKSSVKDDTVLLFIDEIIADLEDLYDTYKCLGD